MREVRSPLLLVLAALVTTGLLAVAIWRLWPAG